ncbi:MAG: hypothetical protein F6K26_39120 [Moorea sp. SIO2I5]|nr:hypothetical protein [Moorena sp. SIO2I5]
MARWGDEMRRGCISYLSKRSQVWEVWEVWEVWGVWEFSPEFLPNCKTEMHPIKDEIDV